MTPDVRVAHRELTAKVMGRSGISGTAIGQKGGKPCLTVYVSDAKAGKGVPRRVHGYPVVIENSGAFKRL